ncbi:MAG: hypothetical protein IVW57_15855 [Ktedonobacterales bacterium]|nr:hypothetical protein [Ktedonobacterales bacterium]
MCKPQYHYTRRRITVVPAALGSGWRILDTWLGVQPTPYKSFRQACHAARALARRLWKSREYVEVAA